MTPGRGGARAASPEAPGAPPDGGAPRAVERQAFVRRAPRTAAGPAGLPRVSLADPIASRHIHAEPWVVAVGVRAVNVLG